MTIVDGVDLHRNIMLPSDRQHLVQKMIWERAPWQVWYESSCSGHSGPVVRVRGPGRLPPPHFHTKRWLLPNRPVTDCVMLAIQWVLNTVAVERRAQAEVEIASEEADALTDFAKDIEALLV